MSQALRQLAATGRLKPLVDAAHSPNRVDFDFEQCPAEVRGEAVCVLAYLDGFAVRFVGDDVALATNSDYLKLGDRWFEVVKKYRNDVLFYLTDTEAAPRTVN